MKNKEQFILNQKQIALKLGITGREDLLPTINQERDKISKIFMHNEVIKEMFKHKGSKEEHKNFEEIKYSLSNIRSLINKNLSNEQLLDILFYCPFKFPDQKDEYFEINSNDNESLKIFFPASTPDSNSKRDKQHKKQYISSEKLSAKNINNSRESVSSISDSNSDRSKTNEMLINIEKVIYLMVIFDPYSLGNE